MNLVFTLLLLIPSVLAAESTSFVLQDEVPNYASYGQYSGGYSLYGDTTWHMQPVVSPSYTVTMNPSEVENSSSSADTGNQNQVGNQEGGLREESIANKLPESEAGPAQGQSSSATPEQLAFNPNEPNIRLYVGSSSSTAQQIVEQLKPAAVQSSSAASVQSSSSSNVATIQPCTEEGIHPAPPTKVRPMYVHQDSGHPDDCNCLVLKVVLWLVLLTLITLVLVDLLLLRKIRQFEDAIDALQSKVHELKSPKKTAKKSTSKKSTRSTKR